MKLRNKKVQLSGACHCFLLGLLGVFAIKCLNLKLQKHLTAFLSFPLCLRRCVINDILLATAVFFISWTSVNHRAWQWRSVQVDVSCVGYGHLAVFIWGISF